MRFPTSVAWVGVALLMLAACTQSPQAKEAKYLEKGKIEFEKQNYAIAVLHFKNAAAVQPNDAEPYYQLGLTNLALGDLNTAAIYLKTATELNPRNMAAKLKLAEVMSTSRNLEVVQEAQKLMQDVLAVLPDDVDALHAVALAELRLGKTNDAEGHLEQALRNAPGNLKSSIALAQTRLVEKDPRGAEEALKQAVAQAPRSAEPRRYLGDFYLAQGRAADAEEQFRRALTIDPKNGAALLGIGGLLVRAGKTDEADRIYRQVAALPSKQYRPIHALFLYESGKREEATKELEKLVAADAEDRNVRTDLVKVYLAANRIGDAEKVLTAALKKNALDVDALIQRSRIYLGSGKLAEAQVDLNRVLHFRGNSVEAYYLLSKVAQARGDATLRKQELGEALRFNPAYLPARIELAQLLLMDGAGRSALALLDEAPKEQKGSVEIAVQRNWALLSLGEKVEARKGIDAMRPAGKIPDALLQDAVLKLDQKDYAGARALAEDVSSESPEDVRALMVMVQSYSAQNQLQAGLQKARQYAAAHTGSASVQQFVGQLLLTNGDRAGARQAFEKAKSAKPGLVTAELALAQIDMGDGKRNDARRRLLGLISTQSDSVPARVLLGQLDMTEGKNDAAIEHFRKAVAADGRNSFAVNGLAYLLAENKQVDEALKYAQKAKEIAPNEPAVDDTLGWTYFQKGMYAAAVPYFEKAVTKGGTALRRYHLAMAYLKAGDPTRGREALDAALKMDPTLPEAQAAREMFRIGL